jgi:hypothetical protein
MKQIEKALARVKRIVNQELNGVTCAYIHDDGLLYMEFDNGMNFSLSDKEVQYQAEEYDAENTQTNPTDFYHNMINESDYNPELIEYYSNNHLDTSKSYDECVDDFMLWADIKNLKLAIDVESVNIYIDNGEDEEPTHVCYWNIEEVEEDAEVMISIANAINLFHTEPKKLLEKLGLVK